MQILYEMFLNYCKNIADNHGIKFGNVKKLVSNLDNKTNYVVYYRNLLLYLSLEMKLTKIHKFLKLKQFYSLKNTLILTLKKRKIAANNFEKDFFKLMINCVYW